MMNKMDLVDVVRTTSIVYERKGVILRARFIDAPIFFRRYCGTLNVSFKHVTRNVYDVMVSIFIVCFEAQ
jgi:hypothetical protein